MKQRIVLIGGGFVGTFAARLLAKKHLPNTEVILLSQTDHFLFAPLLIESLAGDISVESCSRTLPAWANTKGICFIQGKALEVRRETHTLIYEDGKSSLKEELHYDDLVFAQGGAPNFFKTIGAKEHAYTLKVKEDVQKIHTRLEQLINAAQKAETESEKRALLTVGVAGGGPAGIESIGSLRKYLRTLCIGSRKGLLPFLSFFVIESSPEILPGFPDALRLAAKQELTRQGIALYTGEAVTEVSDRQVKTPARVIDASLLLWTAGIAPNAITCIPPFDTSPSGFPALKNTLQLDEHHFIAGDVAALEWNEKRVPKNGQLAMQLAQQIAATIVAHREGKPTPTYTPQTKGFFLGMGEMGFLAVGTRVFRSHLINWFRLFFYRYRMWQIL